MAALIAISCLAALVGAIYLLRERKSKQPMLSRMEQHSPNAHEPRGIPVYGLQHGRLNLRLPTQSMWMNMGFWRDLDDPYDFPEACKALLKELILAAGLLNTEQSSISPTPVPINLLDIGFGCGDQILELFKGDDFDNLHIEKYVGITGSKNQFTYAHSRLQSMKLMGDVQVRHGSSRIYAFRGDASLPTQWPSQLGDAVETLRSEHTWLLGLDSLYHLAPSRLPLFKHANTKIGASLMAFDLFLAKRYETLPFSTRILLRLVCLLTAVPYRNLMTEADYRNMLVEAGYSTENIHLKDISSDVFAPLVRFLDAQHTLLKTMGMSLGAFRVAKLAFGWWADTGIVRGYIVVAKHDNPASFAR